MDILMNRWRWAEWNYFDSNEDVEKKVLFDISNWIFKVQKNTSYSQVERREEVPTYLQKREEKSRRNTSCF